MAIYLLPLVAQHFLAQVQVQVQVQALTLCGAFLCAGQLLAENVPRHLGTLDGQLPAHGKSVRQ
ncbi:hypothetical protein [Limnohabitans sp. Rim8]|uniref:hypothetical protein n=1 Tax=Limnohabitans sp. Rim8 TaxID=1100718 RepID=UPI0026313674|nr:hypothetical protein [Limnohabitans sp. Rim8]